MFVFIFDELIGKIIVIFECVFIVVIINGIMVGFLISGKLMCKSYGFSSNDVDILKRLVVCVWYI